MVSIDFLKQVSKIRTNLKMDNKAVTESIIVIGYSSYGSSNSRVQTNAHSFPRYSGSGGGYSGTDSTSLFQRDSLCCKSICLLLCALKLVSFMFGIYGLIKWIEFYN